MSESIKYPFEIVDKETRPKKRNQNQNQGKWQLLFDPLPENKAIRFQCPSRNEAMRLGCNIQSSILNSRRTEYRLSCRSIPEGDIWLVYIWKVPKEKEVK